MNIFLTRIYQNNVKDEYFNIAYKIINSAGEVDDISLYTSPLKLFDYVTTGKIIISSNLKVLREIIGDRNAYLINSTENIYEWRQKIQLAKKNQIKNLIMGKITYLVKKI